MNTLLERLRVEPERYIEDVSPFNDGFINVRGIDLFEYLRPDATRRAVVFALSEGDDDPTPHLEEISWQVGERAYRVLNLKDCSQIVKMTREDFLQRVHLWGETLPVEAIEKIIDYFALTEDKQKMALSDASKWQKDYEDAVDARAASQSAFERSLTRPLEATYNLIKFNGKVAVIPPGSKPKITIERTRAGVKKLTICDGIEEGGIFSYLCEPDDRVFIQIISPKMNVSARIGTAFSRLWDIFSPATPELPTVNPSQATRKIIS